MRLENEKGHDLASLSPVAPLPLINKSSPKGSDSASSIEETLTCAHTPVVCLELTLERKTLGALVICAPESEVFNDEELGFLTGLAENLSYGISAIRARDERKRAEEELEIYTERLKRSNQDLQDFAFVASHDLQEPLRKVQSFGDILKDEYGDSLGETGLDYLERMSNAAGRMQTLIRDLLNYSRITTRPQPFTAVDLNQVIQEVLVDLETRIGESDGRIEIEDLPTLEADPAQMRQLFQNLLVNGLKFHGKEKPFLRVFGRVSRDGLCHICVRDNGIGFEEKHHERIFAPFQRLHGRNAYEGTGMGLAICRKIAERHRGTITATSTPGQGSTFTIRLPMMQPNGQSCFHGIHEEEPE
jgi:signal transduction histidine kinase